MKNFLIFCMSILFLIGCVDDKEIINNEEPKIEETEEELPMLINPPRVYNTPTEISSSKEGISFTVKTQFPAMLFRTLVSYTDNFKVMDCEFENEEKPKIPYSIDRKLYKLTQLDSLNFEITIKPVKENRDIVFEFSSYGLAPSGDGTLVHCRVSE